MRRVPGNDGMAFGGIGDFVARHGPDELLLTANIFDHGARLRSFEIAAGVGDAL